MALTTDIDPRRPRFFYVRGDRKALHMVIKDFDTIVDEIQRLDFEFNHDGVLGTGWYRQAFTEEDLLDTLAHLDALPELVTIDADLLRVYWQWNAEREARNVE